MQTKVKNSFLAAAMVVAVVSTLTTGCAPLIFGGAVMAGSTTVSSAADRRSMGAQVNDGVLETRVNAEISRVLGQNAKTHITVTAYNGRVLLTGEVETPELKAGAAKTARESLDVKQVIDELAVMQPVGLTQRMSDSTLATKVRSNIVGNKNVSINQMKVVVDRGVVHLMGLLTPEENRAACESAAKTNSVVRVISHVEILSADRIEKMRAEEAERQARLGQNENNQPQP